MNAYSDIAPGGVQAGRVAASQMALPAEGDIADLADVFGLLDVALAHVEHSYLVHDHAGGGDG
jgi:hypothetical protein